LLSIFYPLEKKKKKRKKKQKKKQNKLIFKVNLGFNGNKLKSWG
jgi:hypothetical protein